MKQKPGLNVSPDGNLVNISQEDWKRLVKTIGWVNKVDTDWAEDALHDAIILLMKKGHFDLPCHGWLIQASCWIILKRWRHEQKLDWVDMGSLDDALDTSGNPAMQLLGEPNYDILVDIADGANIQEVADTYFDGSRYYAKQLIEEWKEG